MLIMLAVALGGAIGAVSRFATVVLMQNLLGSRYPYGTLMVNCIGSFLAGFLMILIMERMAASDYWRLFLVVGFLGAYTTFSSFSWETWALYQNGQSVTALFNVIINNLGSLTLALLGIHCARLIGS
ncbi:MULTISPECIES: fluoride efflux transporter CrcB [unclassified Legionella]|uniref:fluoride efflux transporter CrcB n=1 Tax=unclassified Legionella TaxID=2622702 RepID=UPI001F5E3A0D|nr:MULTISPECIES: fluoride efflux transporter CrcB [unclassified Legionella]MDI9817823.1 fluoride efflux transporter CrcB [Legionella sp. PL877]